MKKQVVISILVWSLVVGVSVGWNIINDKREYKSHALESAKVLFDQILLTQFWNAKHGGVYLPITAKIKPNPYLKDSLRDVTTLEGVELTKISPALMIKQLSELAKIRNGVQFHITSLNPIRPENKATDWEAKWLKAFEDGEQEISELINDDDIPLFRFMAPLEMKKSCLTCHADQGYKLGDIRGGISITIPLQYHMNPLPTIISHGIVLIIGFIGIIACGLMLRKSYHILEKSNTNANEALIQATQLSDSLKAKHSELEDGHMALAEAHLKLKETQAQLLQQEKMASVGQLAAGVAHEINNPMGFITSNLHSLEKYATKIVKYMDKQSEILSSHQMDTEIKSAKEEFGIDFIIEDISDLLKESLDGASRVTEIVKNLKSFSRVDQAEVTLSDLNDCIESTLKIIWNELKYKITVNKEYGDIPSTYCNPQELNQVFMNLIMNASHAIEEKGEITIKSWQDQDKLKFSITDTGSGIDPDKIEHIFEPFFTTKPVGKGTGLGLSICYDIMKKHNGEIKVESEVGKGTTFTVILPICKNADPKQKEKTAVC